MVMMTYNSMDKAREIRRKLMVPDASFPFEFPLLLLPERSTCRGEIRFHVVLVFWPIR